MGKVRGFEEIREDKRAYGQKVAAHGQSILLHPTTKLPTRADAGSAGYDFYSPTNFTVLPGDTQIVYTNVKAYMQEDEVLKIYPRSSLGNKGIVLANTVGIIDASYYENEKNDGNIGIMLKNTSGRAFEIHPGDRIAQGIFEKFLVADADDVQAESRNGGFGSSGR